MKSERREALTQYAVLGLIVVIGAGLRLINLRTNPAWYPDEGSDLNIAWNLWQGRIQYFAVDGSLLVAARAPLFHLILVALFNLMGYDIFVARLVAAAAGIVTIPLMFLAFRTAIGGWRALAAAAFFAIFPTAVLYNRWAFDYNLHMPLFVLCFWGLWGMSRSGQSRWMLLASLATMLSLLTAWTAVALLPCLALVGWLCNRKGLLWGLPLALSLPALYLAFSFWNSPAAFAEDFALTFLRSGGNPLAQLASILLNYPVFIASSFWFALGVIGLFLIEPRQLRLLLLLFFFAVLFSVLRFSVVSEVAKLGFYRILGLVPFLSLGIAAFFLRATTFLIRLLSDDFQAILARVQLPPRAAGPIKSLAVPLFTFLVLISILLAATLNSALSVYGGFQPRGDDVLAPPDAAAATVQYLNGIVQPDDVVLASPQLGWAVNARVADFQQTLAYDGYPTDNYPIPVKPWRFRYDPRLSNARFVVVDRMWREWGVENIAAMNQVLDPVLAWPVAFKARDIVVYRNPNR